MNPLMHNDQSIQGERASREEQMQFDRIVSGASEHLWGEGGKAIEGMFSSGMRPKDVVATVTTMFLQKGIEAVRSPEDADSLFSDPSLKTVDVSDEKIAGWLKERAGAEIMEDVIEFGKRTGHLRFKDGKDEEKFQEEAVALAVDMFLKQAAERGETDPEEAYAEMQQLARLEGMELPPVARQTPIAEGVGQALGRPPAGPPDGMPLMPQSGPPPGEPPMQQGGAF